MGMFIFVGYNKMCVIYSYTFYLKECISINETWRDTVKDTQRERDRQTERDKKEAQKERDSQEKERRIQAQRYSKTEK